MITRSGEARFIETCHHHQQTAWALPVAMFRARALPTCLLLLASVAAEGDLLLTSLPAKLYRGSRWRQTLVETWGSNKLKAFTRELKGGKVSEETEPKAVVKVVARAKLPVRMLVEVFQSQDEAVVEAWNPVIGEVQHFASGEQLQTYKLPWPFAPREYLVRCSESKVARSGFQAACAPIDGHPKAPPRTDRVRGKSETIWRDRETWHLQRRTSRIRPAMKRRRVATQR